MNTSRPRTFSMISTLTSPSLKRPISACPTGNRRCRAMSCASAAIGVAAEQRQGLGIHDRPNFLSDSEPLAGVEGFEPPYGGIKTRCLTTWRHPRRTQTVTLSATGRAAANDPRRGPRICATLSEPTARCAAHPARVRSWRRCTHRFRSDARRYARRADRVAHQPIERVPPPARSVARTTGSQTLRVWPAEKARIVMTAEFRVNSGAWKISAVLTRNARVNHQKPARRQCVPASAARRDPRPRRESP